MAEFQAWPKTPRYYRDIIITEKIDGTNAAVVVDEHFFGEHVDGVPSDACGLIFGPTDEQTGFPEHEYVVYAQSRKRLITPASDNFGFARWVAHNADTLVADLGPGRHFGEWWGQGIQRGYGLDHKRFSLFNTSKWQLSEFGTPGLGVVPIMWEGAHEPLAIENALSELRLFGSAAAEEQGVVFRQPEGICIFHTAANSVFKVTLENDEQPKSA